MRTMAELVSPRFLLGTWKTLAMALTTVMRQAPMELRKLVTLEWGEEEC